MMTSDQIAPPTEPNSGLDLGQVLKRRKLLLVIGLAAGLGLGYLYFIRQPPVYQSVARIMLTQKKAQNLPIETAVFVQRERLANEIMQIRSDALLNEAMTIGELEKRPTFRASGRTALLKGLKVDEIESTDVLQVSFRGSRADDCRAAVDSVVKSYTDYIAQKKNASHDEIKFIITEAITDLANDLKALEASYEEFQQQTPLLISGGEMTDPHVEKITAFATKLTAIELDETEVNAEIRTIKAARDEGGDEAALALLADARGQGIARFVTANGQQKLEVAAGKLPSAAPKVSFTNQLFQLKIELAAARKQFGPRHPKVLQLEEKAQIITDFALRQEATEVDTEVPLPVETQEIDLIGSYLNSLHLRLETLRQQKDKLRGMMATESEKSRSLRQDLVRNDNLKAAIDRKRDAHRELVQRLKDVQLVGTYEGRSATVIAPASVATQVGPDRVKILTIGSVLGLMVGFGLACLIELADKSFRSPDDLMAELGIPVLSHIPFMRDAKKRKAAAGGVGNALITVIRPKSRTAEAYRSVRTALYFSTSGEVNKIVQVTSPVAGDGKSTLAGNLAVAIAHSGKRVLLVDADLRRPTVHKVFGLSNKDGVSTVVSGSCPLHEATHETEVENLSILTCGPRPDNPSEMLLSPEFEQLLEYVRAAFDFVVIDSPPILAVTDPASVAARADGVIITLRLAKRSRDLAKRAVDQLQNVGANILGVVVNGVDSVESYGYRSYSYGGYGYGGYGQGYGGYYANQNGYYDEGPRQQPAAPKRQTVVPDRTNGKH